MRKFLGQRAFIIFAAVVTAALAFFMAPLNKSLSNEIAPWGVMSLQFAFSHERFLEIKNAWGPARMDIFWKLMRLDYLFPLGYGFLFAGIIARLKPHRLLFVFPLVSALLDYLENTVHVFLLSNSGWMPPAFIFLASLFATFKWGFIVLSLMIMTKNFRFASTPK